jgi:plastocyanin
MSRQSRYSTAFGLVATCLAAAWLGSCGGSYSPVTPDPGTPGPTPAPSPTATVLVIEIGGIKGSMSFDPSPASAHVGQQVRWHNADVVTHTATRDGGGFDTGSIPPGATSAAISLSAPGAISYHCAIHPGMVGTLNVTS